VKTVSIIIPTYNRAQYIREAIDSVLNQDAKNLHLEIIVVDDGSTDNTGEVVSTYGNKVQYIRQPNSGVGRARNNGIEHATGEWVAFLDSDDRWLPYRLSLQFSVLDKFPEYKAIHSNFYTFDDTGITIPKGLEFWVEIVTGQQAEWKKAYSRVHSSSEIGIAVDGKPFDIYHGNLFAVQLSVTYVSCWTLLIKRECLTKDIRFAEHLKISEDHWLASKFSEQWDIVFLDVATAENRAHPGPRVSQASVAERLRCAIAICDEIYYPSKSRHRPPNSVIDQQYHNYHVKLFKEYVKRGKREEANALYEKMRTLTIPLDRSLALYRLASLAPFDLAGGVARVTRSLRA
jgi:glycosyltransferase involved in cell wall biosynthesis